MEGTSDMLRWLKAVFSRGMDQHEAEQYLMKKDYERAMSQTDPVEKEKWLSGHYTFKT